MIRAIAVHPHLHQDPVDKVILDHDARRRRRMALKGEGGFEFLLDLPEPVAIPDGAALILEDGREVEVEAAPERLASITARDGPSLMRIAWHLGNRHLPTELFASELRIQRDHVIEDMVRGLGGTVTAIEAPFDPESGAYAGHAHGGHGHGHDHPHGHAHDRHHDHEH